MSEFHDTYKDLSFLESLDDKDLYAAMTSLGYPTARQLYEDNFYINNSIFSTVPMSAVYFLFKVCSEGVTLRYVGQAKNLLKRIGEHMMNDPPEDSLDIGWYRFDSWSFIGQRAIVGVGLAAEKKQEAFRRKLERAYIRLYKPPFNDPLGYFRGGYAPVTACPNDWPAIRDAYGEMSGFYISAALGLHKERVAGMSKTAKQPKRIIKHTITSDTGMVSEEWVRERLLPDLKPRSPQ